MKIKTLLVSLLMLILVGALAVGSLFGIKMKKKLEAEIVSKDNTINSLQLELNSIGDMIKVYMVGYNVKSGTEIKEDDLVSIEVPAKVADQYIQSIDELISNFYMVDLKAGTPLVSSMVLPFEMTRDMRYLDIVVSETPIGIEVDDYVDVRMAFEDGEDFICMSNKRVAGVYGKVIKLIVNEKDIHVYESMKVDAACRRKSDGGSVGYGGDFVNRIYAIKYFEGGAQDESSKYYPIRDSSTEILLRDPNIDGDLSYLYNKDTAQMRKILDKKYVVTSDDIKAYKRELVSIYNNAESEYERIMEQQKLEQERIAAQEEADRIAREAAEAEAAQNENEGN